MHTDQGACVAIDISRGDSSFQNSVYFVVDSGVDRLSREDEKFVCCSSCYGTCCQCNCRSPRRRQFNPDVGWASRPERIQIHVMDLQGSVRANCLITIVNFDCLWCSYELDNRQIFSEAGIQTNVGERPIVVSGQYSFVAPDGQTYWVNYTADENGFHPVVGTGPGGIGPGGNAITPKLQGSLVGK